MGLIKMKAALVNTVTNIVESIIIVDSIDDIVPENYKLVEMPMVEMYTSEEERQLYEVIKEIDPEYPDIPKEGRFIDIGVTKWSEEKGFYEE
jgi:hypothetical protein